MSNTSKGLGLKGSKFWMQAIVNTQLKNELNHTIGDDIEWLTPLSHQENYSEYDLKHPYIAKITGISKQNYSFWPSRQPQWDAIGINHEKKIIYLVEAKAHLDELFSKMSASSQESIDLITKSMRTVFEAYQSKGNFDYWMNKYYQLGNRLTFLAKMNDIKAQTGYQFELVLLNIVNDFTHRPTTTEAWNNHYLNVLNEMIGQDTAPKNVKIINFLVDPKSAFKNPMTNQWTFIVPQVLSYGYSKDDNERLKKNCPSEIAFIECGCISDLFALNSIYQFVNLSALSNDQIRALFEFQAQSCAQVNQIIEE